MKRLTSLVAVTVVLLICISTTSAADLYWDNNGATGGLWTAPSFADGTWDTTTLEWSSSPAGTDPIAWNDANNDSAIFNVDGADGAPGSNALGPDAVINVAAARTANTLTFDSGWTHITGAGNITANGGITIAANGIVTLRALSTSTTPPDPIVAGAYSGVLSSNGDITINAGGRLDINSTSRLGGTGKIVLNGGQLMETNSGTAGTFIPTAKGIEVNGTGIIGYSDGNAGLDNQVSIYSGTITGTGGTTSNGGAGTLIVNGTDQLGVTNNANMTFAKLVVDGGSYRLRNSGTVSDNTFGAAPLTQLADAITLKNNGAIGTGATVTFNANRGITIGTGGGRISGIGLGIITLPGPLTSAGGNTLQIDGRNLTTTSATYGRSGGGITLSNANNTSTFVNTSINIDSSTLTLNESLNAASLSGGSETVLTGGTATNKGGIATGTITIATGKTFTAGSNNANTSFAGRVTGTGSIFTKVGSGTLLLNTVPAEDISLADVHTIVYSGEWSNTGGVNINDGSIKFGNSNSGFATANPVTIGATGTLNMNGVNDTFGSLAGPAGAKVDMNDGGAAATPGNLVLGATSGSTTYSGTITGGGNFTKGNAAGANATQVLAGNSTLGAVAVNFGTLQNNATMTTSGGVTVGASGTLGGTGSIIGAIGNSGIIAPGASVGTLSVTGNVTNVAGSSWSIELSGTTADKLAVTGNIDLSATDTLNVTGAGTGSSWIIGTYTGTETGAFDTITSGYTVTYAGGNITLNAGVTCAPGDLNCDGHVDTSDYVFWRKNGGIAGDANYTAWRSNFGVPPGAGSGGGLSGGAVPEPATLVFAGLAMFFGLAVRRRK